jgi:hypothetical protein
MLLLLGLGGPAPLPPGGLPLPAEPAEVNEGPEGGGIDVKDDWEA